MAGKGLSLSSEGFWGGSHEPDVEGITIAHDHQDPEELQKTPLKQSTAKIGEANRALLDACKAGDPPAVSRALQNGANPQLGISFMFKILHLCDKKVSTEIVLILKSSCDGNS
eukprot:m.118712 g.118712  ORF g.118712 m.118712 type:complete len:113 (+) comp28688_c0_seq4:210-548(+)